MLSSGSTLISMVLRAPVQFSPKANSPSRLAATIRHLAEKPAIRKSKAREARDDGPPRVNCARCRAYAQEARVP
jgi:hypothetical protein